MLKNLLRSQNFFKAVNITAREVGTLNKNSRHLENNYLKLNSELQRSFDKIETLGDILLNNDNPSEDFIKFSKQELDNHAKLQHNLNKVRSEMEKDESSKPSVKF